MIYAHIGMEIHCELNTKTKMFSSASADCKVVNGSVHPNDLGFPGCLPSVNQKAVELGILACDVLGCTINPVVRFDRKNYMYPDLPKGYQITQYYHPLGKSGKMNFKDGVLEIERIHLEEDTAKMIHQTNASLLDYDRAGIPLIEIVTKPTLTSSLMAKQALKELVLRLVYSGITNGQLEQGNIRCDVNVSVSEHPDCLGTKVEIKNLNSYRNVQKAIEYEIKRQTKLFRENQRIESCTRRWDEKSKTTQLLRKKQSSLDYRYFPEPNLLPIVLDEKWIYKVLKEQPVSFDEYMKRLENIGLTSSQAHDLLDDKEILQLFLKTTKWTNQIETLYHICIRDLKMWKNKIGKLCIFPEELALICNEGESIGKSKMGKILSKVLEGESVVQLIAKEKSEAMSLDAIQDLIQNAIQSFPDSIEEYFTGKQRVLDFLVGQVMKGSKGKADPALVKRLWIHSLDTLKKEEIYEKCKEVE